MNDYFTFFYVKHFELPMCMKCAIQINLPCLALPSHRDHQSILFPITTDPNYPGITLARKTQSSISWSRDKSLSGPNPADRIAFLLPQPEG